MFTYKLATTIEPTSKAVTIATNLHGDIVCVEVVEDGIILFTMDKRGKVEEAFEYSSMHHVFLDCLPLLYIEDWAVQVTAWENLFGTYMLALSDL
jgi:hypothetical protein